MGRRFAQHVVAHEGLDLLARLRQRHTGRARLFRRQIATRVHQKRGVPFGQTPRVVIGLAPQHHPVDMRQLRRNLVGRGDATVDHNRQVGEVLFKLMHYPITQRRHFTVGFGRQALEPRIARVHDEGAATCLAHGADKIAHKAVTFRRVFGFVDTDAVFDGDRQRNHVDHGFDALGHQRRLGHQAGAKCAALHPLAGAAAVQVDFVVAPLLTKCRAMRQISRFTATQLQRNRMLLGIELQMARDVPVNQGTGGHHFGVEQRMARQQPVKKAAMAVGPVHHWRDRQLPSIHMGSVDRQSGSVGGGHEPIIPAWQAALVWRASVADVA